MTSAPHLILSVDYEIFGNGSGGLCECILEPAEEMVSIAQDFDAPISFFVEVLEFMAFEASVEAPTGVQAIREQLKQFIVAGHDAQLHLHPQWINAVYNPSSNWSLDMTRWRVGDLDSIEVSRLIKEGKNWLEELLLPVKSDYSCTGFRAGGWCIQPSEPIAEALSTNGMFDSTVAPGFRNLTQGEWCDFRKTPDTAYWNFKSNVCFSDASGVLEIPIATGRISRIRHLKALRQVKSQISGGLAIGCEGSYKGPSSRLSKLTGKAGKLFDLGKVMLDFSTMPSDILIDITKQWLDKNACLGYPIPIVAIAHTKNFTPVSAENLQNFLSWATRQGIRFSSYNHWIDNAGLRRSNE